MVFGLLTSAHDASANLQGGVIVRVDGDGASRRCINAATDKIYVNSRRIIVTKDKSWVKEDRTAGVLINTTLEGEQSSTNSKVTFPRFFEHNLDPFEGGRVSIPFEEKLLNGYRLRDEKITFNSIVMDVAIVKKKKEGVFGSALKSLNEVTKKLPIPNNPFTDGFKMFAEFADSSVQKSIQDDNSDNVQGTLKSGKLSLSFSEDGTCTGDFERTGTIAMVLDTGSSENGVIRVADVSAYCWRAAFRPAFELYFARRPDSGCNQTKNTDYKTLLNPYVAFYVNAVATTPKPTERTVPDVATPKAIDEKDLKHAVADLKLDKKVGAAVATKISIVLANPADKVDGSAIGKVSRQDGERAVVNASGTESVTLDVADAIRRCDAHGIAATKCFD